MVKENEKQNIVDLVALKSGERAVFIGLINENRHSHCHGKGNGKRWRWRMNGDHQHNTSFHYGFLQRLEAMGIRPGILIKKISDHFFSGPVIIEVGRTQLAIGYGMAKKMLVNKG
ncbi:MAG: ferrous iron transport protein A [Spirochaetales bacterium]|nr:ferrous iron transport protein A [Spirochaetales bacterium]